MPGAPGDVAKAGPARGDVVLLQQEMPVQTDRGGAEGARAAGAASVLNAAPFVAAAAPLLAEADYVVANETEFDLYGEELALAGADRLARMRAFAATSGRTIDRHPRRRRRLAATPEADARRSRRCPSRRSIRSAPATPFAAIFARRARRRPAARGRRWRARPLRARSPA